MDKKTICIGYLTDNRRTYTFETFISFLNKIQNKNKIHLLILVTQDNSSKFFQNILQTKLQDIKYTLIEFPSYNNYITKIKTFINFTKFNNMKYCMKFDNDLIINNYVLDFMIDNVKLLKDRNNLYITPTLSSGIPTTDMFIEDFFNEKEKKDIHDLFLKTIIPKKMWGYDYSELNNHTIYTNKWDINNFTDNVNKMSCYYKGIHPIRIDKNSIEYMNKILIKNKDKIFQKQDYRIQVIHKPNYLCNSIFLIDVNHYENLINNPLLYVDPYDEVPVTRYCNLNNLKGLVVRNSFSIHPIYNTISGYADIERKFHLEFTSKK